MSACPPMMAMLWTREGTMGRMEFAFLRRTMLFLFDVLGDFEAFFDVGDASLRRIVDDAGEKLGIENAAGVVVNFRERHAAGIDGVSQLGPEVVGHGLLLIEAGG